MSSPPIERFTTPNGVRIYRIPVEAFPGFTAYCYVILGAGEPTLVDCGSGWGDSNDHLLAGIAALRDEHHEPLDLPDITRIIITHGHIDHFGGVAFMQQQTGARIGVHPLDRRVLTNYEERVIVATKALRGYLEGAGVNPDLREKVLEMYGIAKKHVRSVEVAFSLEEGQPFDEMQVIHTPGHCSGQVCILIEDILLSADHILARITPHQAPESITHYTGLGHYLDSLGKIERLDGIRLALGGHEAPIDDVYRRIELIRASHGRKLERVRDAIHLAREPLNISEISQLVYPDRHGYDILLALEEVGAHVEYLYEHGELAISNLEQVEREDNPPLLYALV